jgi:hypothetical protein
VLPARSFPWSAAERAKSGSRGLWSLASSLVIKVGVHRIHGPTSSMYVNATCDVI